MKVLIAAIVIGLGFVAAATAAPVSNGVTTIEDAKYPNNPEWVQKAYEGAGGS